MKHVISCICGILLFSGIGKCQLIISSGGTAQALAQRLVGEGITISNVTLVSDPIATGFFKNVSGTNIGLDSGIVLTNGRSKTVGGGPDDFGLNGNGTTTAVNSNASSTHTVNVSDADLEGLIGVPAGTTFNATILEFDLVPVGDSIKFRYVFSSEEYPDFACPTVGLNYNDAFAFFIEGPGFPVKKNIALIPGSTAPVTINNINDQGCAPYPQYYVENESNRFFTHNGHTKVFTAAAQVQPCQTYHLKLVIADVADDMLDSGVFLEAKSLSSNVIALTNNTQIDQTNTSYVVEGCVIGSFTVSRPNAIGVPQTVRLQYGGSAVNGVDFQTLPAEVNIPANASQVTLNIYPITDNLDEGTETLKIYATNACGSTTPFDSTIIQLRDYDTLRITPDSTIICRLASLQLQATAGHTFYQWTPVQNINNNGIHNPIVTPQFNGVTYVCTAATGTCRSRDSVLINWKTISLENIANINCQGASNGEITLSASLGWVSPIQYSSNNIMWQGSGYFNNLSTGNYMIKVKDGAGCLDSLQVDIVQNYPALEINNTLTTPAGCTSSDGSISIQVNGGLAPYSYSLNGTSYQPDNMFSASAGNYTVYVKDQNNCNTSLGDIIIPFINGVTLSVSTDTDICEGSSAVISAATTAQSVRWTSTNPVTISDPTSLNPTVNPTATSVYYILATSGICQLQDSVKITVTPAPVANAGDDLTVCYGGRTNLSGIGSFIFSWSPSTYLDDPGIRNPTVNNPTNIIYTLNVIDSLGCRSLMPDRVSVTVLPPAKLFAGWDTAVGIRQPLKMFANDLNRIGFNQYVWSPATAFTNPFVKNPVAVLTEADNQLIVTAYTPENCIGKDTVNVKTYRGPEIYVPGTFTPNGDGLNDVLKAFPVGITRFKYFNVFNRYGQLIFSTTNAATGWNGRVKGVIQNVGTFVWIAEAVDYKGNQLVRKGTTTLIQ